MLPHAAWMMQETYRSPPEGKTWRESVLKSILVVFIFTTAAVLTYVSALNWLGFGIPRGITELGILANGG
jgi:hypothetical protein